MMLSCIFVVTAQVTESGNGFLETFNYDPEMDFNDLLIDGVSEIGWLGEMDPTHEEYAEGAIVDGMLKITLQPEQEGSVGWGFTETMDLTDNPTLTFKYKFAEGTSWYFGAEDVTGGWFDTDDGSSFVFGTDELQEITIDLTTLVGEGGAEIDITQITGIWLLPAMDANAAAGDLYFDDVVLGDAELPTGDFTTGEVTESGNGFLETFNYDPEMDFNDLLIDGVSEIGWLGEMDPTHEEYAEGAIVDGMLKITLQPEQEGSVGWGFTETMDLTDNPTLTFKYKFAEGTSWYFGAEDVTGGWFDTDDGSSFVFGTDELQEITIDLTTLVGEGGAEIDITQITGIWLLPAMDANAAAGDLYFDDIVIGDAVLSTGINKVSVPSNLKIYPNPARTHINIGVDAASVAIFNSVGQKVLSTTNYVKETPINVEGLNPGIYFIKADRSTQKLIIR